METFEFVRDTEKGKLYRGKRVTFEVTNTNEVIIYAHSGFIYGATLEQVINIENEKLTDNES